MAQVFPARAALLHALPPDDGIPIGFGLPSADGKLGTSRYAGQSATAGSAESGAGLRGENETRERIDSLAGGKLADAFRPKLGAKCGGRSAGNFEQRIAAGARSGRCAEKGSRG